MNTKKFIFTILTILMVLIVSFTIIISPYLWKKLTFSYGYCNSFGELDYELGWKLAPNAESCISLKNYLTGEVFFDSLVTTDSRGFRIDEKSKDNKNFDNSILAVGDSHTFGYGSNYIDTWPAQLSESINRNIVNLGVPGYSNLSTYLLLKRNIDILNPELVVFFDSGAFDRAWCPELKYKKQMVPCYFINEEGNVQIQFPDKIFYDNKIKKGIYPGAYLSSGYDIRQYLFIKLKTVFRSLYFKTMFAITKNQNYVSDTMNCQILYYQVDTSKNVGGYCDELANKASVYEINLFYELVKDRNTKLIFIDFNNQYLDDYLEISHENKNENFYFFGLAELGDLQERLSTNNYINIDDIRGLPAYTIKGDGHFNRSGNEIISDNIKNFLIKNNLILL